MLHVKVCDVTSMTCFGPSTFGSQSDGCWDKNYTTSLHDHGSDVTSSLRGMHIRKGCVQQALWVTVNFHNLLGILCVLYNILLTTLYLAAVLLLNHHEKMMLQSD